MRKIEIPTTPETEKKRSKYEYRLALDESLRMRRDLKIPDLISGEARSVPFTAGMARKYAMIYLFTLHFSEQGEKPWVNKVLRYMGWDEHNPDPVQRRRCLMAVRRQIVDLKRDFNFTVELVQGNGDPNADGYRFYKVTSFGLFKQNELLEMLKANREIFIQILESGL